MKKNPELRKTLLLILIYVVGMSVFENLCPEEYSQSLRVLPAAAVFLLLLAVMAREKSFARYGFHFDKGLSWKEQLYCVPMLILATVNLWNGVVLRYSAVGTVCYVLAMLFIGFSEEILFRGFLLRTLEKDSVRTAILVSSLTFGLGHIVNLLNGAEVLPTVLQIVYALAIGLMLSVFAVKTGNILPCCIFHAVFNALGALSNEAAVTDTSRIVICVIITVVALGDVAFVMRRGR